jgi:predicted outer membrane repeat protein
MRVFSTVLCALSLVACGAKPGTDADDTGEASLDADKDGFAAGADCNDSDASINPDATEICDDLDNNCDGVIDEETAADAGVWYADSDSDNYGDANISLHACEMPEGYVEDSTDCDDSDAGLNPETIWYADTDADGYGDSKSTTLSCETPAGHVQDANDCDDTSQWVNPAADEICDGLDNDCDASTSEDGTVAHTATDGVKTDVTASLTGTASAPAEYTVTEGSLNFCDGVHYVNLTILGDASVGSQSQDPTRTILNGAGVGSVLSVWEPGSTVLVSDLTVENGLGNQAIGSTGGGVYCASYDLQTAALNASIDLQLENLIVSNNVATDYGGGIFSVGCDLTVLNSEISYNDSGYFGGGLWLSDGDSSLTGVEIFENAAHTGGGALIWGNQFEGGNRTGALDDVVVSDNTASDIVGGIGLLSGSFSWVGTSGSQGSGAWSNQSGTVNASGLSVGEMTFQAQDVDFGTSADGTDNLHYDIEILGEWVSYNADDDASFSCDEDGCGTSTVTVNGGAKTDSLYTGLLGTVFTVDDIGTLDSFEPWTGGYQSSCPLDFYLLSAVTSDASSWTVEWAAKNQLSNTTLDFKSSTQVGFPLDPSLFYAVAWQHSGCATRYAFEDGVGVGATITGLGTTVGYMYNGTTASYSIGDTVENKGTSTALTWYVNFNVTKL